MIFTDILTFYHKQSQQLLKKNQLITDNKKIPDKWSFYITATAHMTDYDHKAGEHM